MQPSDQRRVLLVGDSHVAGLAPHFKELAEAAGWNVTVYSNVGKSTRWFGQQSVLAALVAQHSPHLIIVVLGTNDGGAEQNPATYKQNIEAVLRQTGRHAKVLWVGTPTIPRSATEDAGAAARNKILAQQPNISAIDGRAMTADLASLRTPDGVHFTVRGSKVWAERIFAEAQPAMNALTVSFSWKHLIVGASIATAVLAGVFYWQRQRKHDVV